MNCVIGMEDLLKMNCVIGLDLSLTSTGIVVLDQHGEVVRAETICPESKGIDRLGEIWVSIADIYQLAVYGKQLEVRGWVLEGYAYGAANAVAACAELGGVVKYRLNDTLNQSITIVPPSTLKKYVTSKGNSQKDMMRLEVFKRWQFDHPSNDVVDAYGLARVGLALAGYDDKLTVIQRQVLAQLRGEKPVKKSRKRTKKLEASNS